MGKKSRKQSETSSSSEDSSTSSSSKSSKSFGRKKTAKKYSKTTKKRADICQASDISTSRATTSVNQENVETGSCHTKGASDNSYLSSLRKPKESLSATWDRLDRLLACSPSSLENTARLMENGQDVTSEKLTNNKDAEAHRENTEESIIDSETDVYIGEIAIAAEKPTEEDDAARTDNPIFKVESANRKSSGSATEKNISLKGRCLAGEVSGIQSMEQKEQTGGQPFTSQQNYISDFPKSDGEEVPPHGLKENTEVSYSTTIPTVHDLEDIMDEQNAYSTLTQSSQLPVEDKVTPFTNNNSGSSLSEERNLLRVERSKSLKLKSERSAIHDKVKGVWICRHCGWQYPNPHPSAKVRRDHKNLCGKFQNVNTWLENEAFDDEGDSDEDMTVSNNRNATDGTELLTKVQSDGGIETTSATPSAETAELIASKVAVSQTTKVDNGKVVVASGETTLSGEDAESLLQEMDTNTFAQDKSSVRNLDSLTSLSTTKPLENNPRERNETTDTKGVAEITVHTGKPVVVVSVATSPARDRISINSSVQNGHKFKTKELQNHGILDHNDSIKEIGRLEVQDKVPYESDMKNLVDTTLNHIVLERSNHTSMIDTHSELDVFSSVKDAKRKLIESGNKIEGKLDSMSTYPDLRDTLEASTSKQKIEYVDFKDPSSAVGYSKIERLSQDTDSGDLVIVRKQVLSQEILSSTTEVVKDVVRVIKEQNTHDLLCPVCGSCITKRVILRKRKRTSIASLEKWHQEVIQDDSPVVMSTGGIHAASTETSVTEKSNILELEEDEDWGCLACLTFFLRRVRGVRRASVEDSNLGAQGESNQNVHVEFVQQASIQHVSCIPLVFPAFPWNPSQTGETKLLEPLLSRKLKESATAGREVTMQVNMSTTLAESKMLVTASGETSDTKDYVNVISSLPWGHSNMKLQPLQGIRDTEQLIQKKNKGCLPFIFPEYLWGDAESGESLVSDVGKQDDTVSLSTNIELQNDQNEIVGFDNEEIQMETTSIIPSSPEIKDDILSEVKEESSLGCLSFAFPEFPWGPGELHAESGSEARVTEKMVENLALHVETIPEIRTDKVLSKQFSEENGCFSFVLPDFHVQKKLSLHKLAKGKETEEDSATVPKLQSEKLHDAQIEEHLEIKKSPETKELEIGDVVIAKSIISNIEILEAANQKELREISPEKDLYAASYKGKKILQEIDIPAEINEVQGPEIEEASVASVDTVQDLVPENSEFFAQEELGCLSFAFPQFPWDPAVENEAPVLEGKKEQGNVDLNIDRSLLLMDEGSSGTVEIASAQSKTTRDSTISNFFKDRISWDCLPAVVPQLTWGGTNDYHEQILEPQNTPIALTQKSKEDQTADNSQEVTTRWKEAPVPCLPDLLSKFRWEHRIIVEEKAIGTPSTELGYSAESVAEYQEENIIEKKSLNRMSLLFPAYPWGHDVVQTFPEGKTTSDVHDSLKYVPGYVTHETRIEAKVTDITSFTPVQTPESSTTEDVQIQSVKLDESVTFLDATIKSNEKLELVAVLRHELKQEPSLKPLTTLQSTGYAALDLEDTTEESLSSRPSTGYALVEALDVEPEISTIDDHERPQKDVCDIPSKATVEGEVIAQEEKHEFQADQQRVCQCFPLPAISWPWPSIQKADFDLQQPLIGEKDTEEDKQTSDPSASLIAVVTTDSVIEVKQEDVLFSATAVAQTVELGVVQSRVPVEPKRQEYLKSIVYGGLDVALASLGVVSSAAGGEAKTLTVIALSLANLIAGFITLLHNIVHLYHYNRPSFEETVGQSLWINGLLAVLSFIIFGSVPPVTYGFSFRSSNDRDYKFGATAVASLCCLLLLGLGKARVRRQPYFATVISLIATGFVASTAGYFAGDYIRKWLKKIGFDYDEPAGAPTQAPPPFFLGKVGDAQVSLKSNF